MAIDVTKTVPLRHLATILSSGYFTVPAGVTKLYVTVSGASGGGSSGFNYQENGHGSTGGAGVITGGWVNVAPGQSYPVIIGAGGSGTSGAGYGRYGTAGSSAGTTYFDGAVIAYGGTGANAGSHHSPGGATPGATGGTAYETSLPVLYPTGAMVRVNDTSTSNTTVAGGNAGQNTSVQGGAGQPGKVQIFGM